MMFHKAGILILALCIAVAFSSCGFKVKTAHEKELEVIAEYIIKNSDCEGIKAFQKTVNDGGRSIVLSFTGVTDLEHTDNIAYAMNSYLEDTPDCFINKEGFRINIITQNYDVISAYPPDYFTHFYACLESEPVIAGTEQNAEETVRIKGIDVQVTPSFPVTDFLDCKVQYEYIVFSQDVQFDSLEELANPEWIRGICLKELETGQGDIRSDTPELDYETYSEYCGIANRINALKGFKFATVSLYPGRADEWKKEYGYDFVYVEPPAVEIYTLTLNEDYSVTRDEHDLTEGLCWYIECDGEHVLTRAAAETVLTKDLQGNKPGKYMICLIAWIDGEYTRVSNIVEYSLV